MSQKNEAVNLTVWRINGHEFELDLQDVETAERYEKAFNAMDEDEKLIPKDGPVSVYLKAYCEMFRKLFDAILGEGASDKLFGSKNNSRVMTNVYEDFLDFVSTQASDVLDTQNRIVNRYTANRAQRRQGSKVRPING